MFGCFPTVGGDVSPEALWKIDETVERALRIARKKVDDLGLSPDDGRVLFTYTLQQMLVLLFMESPEEVHGVVDFLKDRLKRDLASAGRFLN